LTGNSKCSAGVLTTPTCVKACQNRNTFHAARYRHREGLHYQRGKCMMYSDQLVVDVRAQGPVQGYYHKRCAWDFNLRDRKKADTCCSECKQCVDVGCTDSLASNYDSNATVHIEDSCTYNALLV
jgi:hypothetical protein